MRRVRVPDLGMLGKVSDVAPWELARGACVAAQDYHLTPGLPRLRKGWAYDGSVADVASNLHSAARFKFGMPGVIRTITTASGAFYIHQAAGAGTAVVAGGGPYLPRAFYNDTLILVDPNGSAPVLLYSGSDGSSPTATSPTFTAGESTITGTMSAAPGAGMYAMNQQSTLTFDNRIWTASRVVAGGTTSVFTVEHVKAANTMGINVEISSNHLLNYALTFPAMLVREEATVTIGASGVVTGYGTNFQSGDTAYQSILILVPDAGTPIAAGKLYTRAAASGASCAVALMAAQATKTKAYLASSFICRDACVYKQSIVFAGLANYPNRVAIGPPGWDMLAPPGAVLPWDPTATFSSVQSMDYLLLPTVDVPAPSDADPMVAVLPTPSAILVLKRNSVHAIYGAFPSFTQAPLAPFGCIDVRSAIAVDEGAFWCGEQGVFRFAGGKIDNLVEGRIEDEWRRLVREGVTYCSAGVTHGHLVVSIKTASTSRTYTYNLRRGAWVEMSNVLARYLFTARVPGEVEALFAVDDARQGRVLDLTPCFSGTKITARDAQTKATADATDAAGSGPTLKLYTGQALGGDVEVERRLVDLELAANVYDTATPSTALQLQVVVSGGLLTGGSGEQTETLTSVSGDTTDLVDRHFRKVLRSGRTHQLKIDSTAVDADNSKTDIGELILSFRDGRPRA